MTQDEIIEMAKQANAIPIHKDFNQLALIGTENIEEFAKLVAQHERHECLQLCTAMYELAGDAMEVFDAIQARGKND